MRIKSVYSIKFINKISKYDNIKRNILEKEKKMISEIEVTKSKNEIEYDIEYQDAFDLSLLTFRRKE